RYEKVDLFLDRVPVPAPVRVSLRRLPPASEAFEGDGEVAEAETFAEESDLEVLRIHSDLRRLVRDVRDRNDGVLGHGSPLSLRRRARSPRSSQRIPIASPSTNRLVCAPTSSAHRTRQCASGDGDAALGLANVTRTRSRSAA